MLCHFRKFPPLRGILGGKRDFIEGLDAPSTAPANTPAGLGGVGVLSASCEFASAPPTESSGDCAG